jgi:Zn-dependent protease with chaperone function
MILATALLSIGLVAPYALRRLGGHTSPRLVVAAQLAGLALTWLGIIDLISVWAMPDHGLLGLCRAAFFEPHDIGDVNGEGMLLVAALALGGRAAWAMSKTYRVVRRTRRRLGASGLPTSGGLTFARLGTVACTVGFMRPRIVVDNAHFAVLSAAQQRAVIAHERSHARGWHAVIDLVARGLAAGLAPWPGARVAYGEIRRHLEAVADDWAARLTSRRDVAAAIVEAALPPAPAAVLGAAGWAVWRVDRLLSPQPRLLRHALVAITLVGLAAMAVLQMSGHALTGVHLFPPPLPCCMA